MVETDMDRLEEVVAEFRRLQEGWKQTLSPHVYRAVLVEIAEQCDDRIEDGDDTDSTGEFDKDTAFG